MNATFSAVAGLYFASLGLSKAIVDAEKSWTGTQRGHPFTMQWLKYRFRRQPMR
jgi:hypothetical protein